MPTVVIDPGAYTLKLGLAGGSEPAHVVPNAWAKHRKDRRRFVADEVARVVDQNQLYFRRPVQRGYPCNFPWQHMVFERAFGSSLLDVDTSQHDALCTMPLLAPTSVTESMEELLFEQYAFQRVCLAPAPLLALLQDRSESGKQGVSTSPSSPCALVLDIGHSFAHAVPVMENVPVLRGVRRVDVGGKLLTNLLKEQVSFRAWNVMDETTLMTHVKEQACYVSLDFHGDMRAAAVRGRHNRIRRHYVMPDGTASATGAPALGRLLPQAPDPAKPVPEGEQVLVMNNECISIPEVLFNPQDIGLHHGGIGDAVVQAVEAACADAPHLRMFYYDNILVTGGSSLFRNLIPRLQAEVRALAPAECRVNVTHARQPITAAWSGGSYLASQSSFADVAVSRQTYQEHGHSVCRQSFLV